jgi:hypothetical protein
MIECDAHSNATLDCLLRIRNDLAFRLRKDPTPVISGEGIRPVKGDGREGHTRGAGQNHFSTAARLAFSSWNHGVSLCVRPS